MGFAGAGEIPSETFAHKYFCVLAVRMTAGQRGATNAFKV